MFDHEHPLSLVDLWTEQLQREEDFEEDEEDNDDVLIAKQGFRCLCFGCKEEINWYHRYYYSCCQCVDNYYIHRFCAKLPERLEDVCEVGHTLEFDQMYFYWNCAICGEFHNRGEFVYYCGICFFTVDAKCMMKKLQKNIIYHPSHKHPLVCNLKRILDKCDACGKEHKGTFYHCPTCAWSTFIHSNCAFQPTKLEIQQTTNDVFTHIHPLTLAYSFLEAEIRSKFYPQCRVCLEYFDSRPNQWIYKCENCRYYTHFCCATSRNEPFMSILTSPSIGKSIKNYEDDEHDDLLHLPFKDASYSLLKHLFFKDDDGLKVTKTHNISHQHPLILEDVTSPTSSRISFHDPMKRIELLCDGCVRPITSGPIYVCAVKEDEHCNFVLHEWCARLPTELYDHFHHPKHTMILHSKPPYDNFFRVFECHICELTCNGFVYCCEECEYLTDVNCAFLPREIIHTSHPNHLLSRVYEARSLACCMCGPILTGDFYFCCYTCDVYLDVRCAFLIPETTRHKCDKHPMKLSYYPIENHKNDYFCEVCEDEINPQLSFYHCRECMQSMHTACAPSILRNETYTTTGSTYYDIAIHKFVNMKFGVTYDNIKVHPHPLSFIQGIENYGECAGQDCDNRDLHRRLVFKCLNCEFVLHYKCCERLIN